MTELISNAQIITDAEAAIAYIEDVRHGWTQGRYFSPAGEVCLDGAMRAVTYIDPLGPTKNVTTLQTERYWGLRFAVRNHIGRQITFWNDDPGRTKEDVLTMLREFVAARRGAGGNA